jgi:hypothetical protein
MHHAHRIPSALLAMASAMTLSGCASGVVAPADPNEVTLAVGTRGTANGINVGLVAIDEDSRCPEDVVCVWAGSVKARASLRIGAADTPVTLNSGLEPFSADVGTYRVRIVEVLPHRKTGSAIPSDAYRVTLRVDRIP